MCDSLTSITSGTVTMTTDNITTMARYECVPGYYIVGDSNITCESSGLWSSVEPRCGKH